MKPFFTRNDLSSFDVRHIDSDTGKPLDVGGEPELLEVLNEKVQPVLERLAAAEEALKLIAAPKRSDGTYNRGREACEELARAYFASHGEHGDKP